MQSEIKSALVSYLESLSLGIPLNYPNMEQDTSVPAGDVTIHFNEPEVVTLGQGGEDEHRGFMQILLKYPVGEGDGALMAMADTIRQAFLAGQSCSYGSQTVTIINCGLGTFDNWNSKFVCPITITWYARTRR